MLPGKTFLIAKLRQLNQRLAPTHHAEIIVRRDEVFDWSSLDDCSHCTLPGNDHGQQHDVRYSTEGSDGLHARVYQDRVVFHLDLANACQDVIAHGIKDTKAAPIGLLGAALGYWLAGSRGLVFGGIAGAVIGSQTASRVSKFYTLADLRCGRDVSVA